MKSAGWVLRLQSKKGIERVCAVGAVAAGGVMVLTDNLSTAIIVAGITGILIFVAHPKIKPFLQLIAAGAVVVVVETFISFGKYFK